MKNIRFKSALKFWILSQIGTFIFLPDSMNRLLVTIGLPITLVYVLFTLYYFDTFPRNQKEYDEEVDENKYNEYVDNVVGHRKAIERDKKLDKLLK